MNTTHTEPRPCPVLARVAGAAVTGAVVAGGAVAFLSWARRESERACASTDGLCFTWWDIAALPLTFGTALIVLLVVYRQLGIGPRLAVVPPTILLGPFPLTAADATAGSAAVTLVGAVWSCSLALTAWSRYRVLGCSAAAALMLASFIVLYG